MTRGVEMGWMIAGLGVALGGAPACNGLAPSGVPVGQTNVTKGPPPPPRIVVGPLAIAAVDTAPQTGAAPIAGAVVDARALVITADGTNSGANAIENTLQYLGTPFDVLNASTGPALTAGALASGAHGKYNAVFLDIGDLSGAFTEAEWAALTAYEVQFGVRRVALYAAPSASYGLAADGASINPETAPFAVTCTAAGKALFVGTNCDQPVRIVDGYAYPSTPADGATTPLLVDANGAVYGATRKYADGREALVLTFGQTSDYVSYLELAYGLVNWATHGLFIGQRHVYAMPQIDDLFLASAIYTGGKYRITDADLQSFADWQAATRARPVMAGLRIAWVVNGAGSAEYPNDPLTAKAVALGPAFAWINHTWDHPVLDTLSYASVLMEFMQNDQYLRGLGLMPYASTNAVTPNISGLSSADAMRAIHDVGIQQLVSDTSEPGQNNPSPNAGIWNALQPTVLEIPRKPTDLYFNVSQPPEWIPEYEALNKITTIDYPTMLDVQSNQLFRDMLNGNSDPWMFHQANTRNYDGAGHSLLSDLLDETFAKYQAVMTFPAVSPTLDDLATRVKNRMALDASGVNATIGNGSITLSVAHAATVPVTGLCTPGAESYGGQTISYVTLGDGQTASYPLSGCAVGPSAGATDGGVGSLDGGLDGGVGGGLDASPDGGVASGLDAGPSQIGSPVTGGPATPVGTTDVPQLPSGCACALGASGGSGWALISVGLLLGGCALGGRRRRRRRG